jgi:hypothetical protein
MIESQKIEATLTVKGNPNLGDLRDVFQDLLDRFPAATVKYVHFSERTERNADGHSGAVCFEYEI